MTNNYTAAMLAILAFAGLTGASATAEAPVLGEHRKVASTPTHYQGRPAVELRDLGGGGEDRMALLRGVALRDGEIRLRLSGELGPNAAPDDRGFVGVAFRVSPDLSSFEGVYLRPTNGRAADPVRRSRTVQYHSLPHWSWHKLREQSPGTYESAADIGPGEWIDLRIVLAGARAEVFVGEGETPELVVRDLKLGDGRTGGVALWVGPGTVARFADVKVTPAAKRFDQPRPPLDGAESATASLELS